MTIDTKTIASIPEANPDSSHVARTAEEITGLEQMDDIELTDDEKIDLVARNIR